jgi:hypothetical protein
MENDYPYKKQGHMLMVLIPLCCCDHNHTQQLLSQLQHNQKKPLVIYHAKGFNLIM